MQKNPKKLHLFVLRLRYKKCDFVQGPKIFSRISATVPRFSWSSWMSDSAETVHSSESRGFQIDVETDGIFFHLEKAHVQNSRQIYRLLP